MWVGDEMTDVDGGWINNQGRDVHAACYSDKHLIFAPNLRMNHNERKEKVTVKRMM
jgi:hypothetical protein